MNSVAFRDKHQKDSNDITNPPFDSKSCFCKNKHIILRTVFPFFIEINVKISSLSLVLT